MPRGKKKEKPENKAAFIRSQPRSMPADEVVKAGKKLGFEFDRNAVHKTRWLEKSRRLARAGRAKEQAPPVTPKAVRVVNDLRSGAGKKSGTFAPDEALALEELVSEAIETFGAALRAFVRNTVLREVQTILAGARD